MTKEAVEFSICVPTYNRARLLPHFFEQLKQQPAELFELVIVNDGSSDDTSEVVRALAQTVTFRVRHADIERGGRARALNRALDEATGRFIVILGDDDALAPKALERMLRVWEGIPLAERSQFCGVCGLSADQDGALVGDAFPSDIIDSTFFDVRVVQGIRGDKREAVQRSVIGGYRFRVFDGEKRVPTSSLWLHVAKSHKTRFVNEIWCVVTYRADGMSKSLTRIRATSPNSTAAHYREVLQSFPSMPSRLKIRYVTNFVRFAMHGHSGLVQSLRGLPMPESAIGIPAGAVAALLDRIRLSLTRAAL